MRFFSACLQLAAAVSFAALAGLAATAPAAAANSVPDQVQHYLDCLNLMLTNPAEHAKQCSPGHDWTGPFSNAYGWSSAPAPSPSTECPPHEHKYPKFEKPTAFYLTGGKWDDEGGDDCHHHHGCKPEPMSFEYGAADLGAGLVEVSGRGCCDTYKSAYDQGGIDQGMVLEVGCRGGCDVSGSVDPVSPAFDGMLVQVGYCDGGSNCDTGFDLGSGDFNPMLLKVHHNYDRGCPSAFVLGAPDSMLLNVSECYQVRPDSFETTAATPALPEYLI